MGQGQAQEVPPHVPSEWGEETELDAAGAGDVVGGLGGVKPTPIAFVTPLTPCEKAWADLCDQKRNRDVERIVAATGGWDEWEKHRLSFRAFSAAFNGDNSLILSAREGGA
jgi:hypothetical protein